VIKDSSDEAGSSSSGSYVSSDEEQIIMVTRKIQTLHTGGIGNVAHSKSDFENMQEELDILKQIVVEKDKEIDGFKGMKKSRPVEQISMSNIPNPALDISFTADINTFDKEIITDEINTSNKNLQVTLRSNKSITSKKSNGPGLEEDDKVSELTFKIVKSKELVNKYQDFFEDLQSSYSLPEGLTEEIERLQEKYLDLFSGNLGVTQEFCQEEDQEERLHSEESYDENYPVNNNELNVSHIKHKANIPVLDLSKVQALSSSEEGEEESEQEHDQEPNKFQNPMVSVSSDGDPEEFLHILNDDSDPRYRLDSDETNELDQDLKDYVDDKEVICNIKPAASQEFEEQEEHFKDDYSSTPPLSK
jgi:hypothetical protein